MNRVCVCLPVRVFLSHQKSQHHEIVAQCVIRARLVHDEARFLHFSFLRILGAFFVFKKNWGFQGFLSRKFQPFQHLGPCNFDKNTFLIQKKKCTQKNPKIFRIFFSYTNSKMMCLLTISSVIKQHSYLKF